MVLLEGGDVGVVVELLLPGDTLHVGRVGHLLPGLVEGEQRGPVPLHLGLPDVNLLFVSHAKGHGFSSCLNKFLVCDNFVEDLFQLLAVVANLALLEEVLELKDEGSDELREADLVAVVRQVGQDPRVHAFNGGVLEPVLRQLRLGQLQHGRKVEGLHRDLLGLFVKVEVVEDVEVDGEDGDEGPGGHRELGEDGCAVEAQRKEFASRDQAYHTKNNL